MEVILSELATAKIDIPIQTLKLLRELDAVGGLSFGWPHSQSPRDQKFFVWFPESCVSRCTTSIISSRLGRELAGKHSVFRVLRSAVAQLDPRKQSVISAEKTTLARYVQRACELYGVPVVRVAVATSHQSLFNWAREVLQRAADNRATCFVSNDLVAGVDVAPIRDRIEVFESDQLLVVHLRPRGNLRELVRARLARAPSRVFLAIGHDELVPHSVASELMDLGAIGWYLRGESQPPTFPLEGASGSRPPAPVIPRLARQSGFFTHCTRGAPGPWPDQTEEDYLDELILGNPAEDRSSLSALVRIVTMQRLLATNCAIRGGSKVVSFTAATLDSLSEMRRFRPHRGRWDFEPYGISIDKAWLRSLGARKVIYGQDSTWDSLREEDRPYFQKVRTEVGGVDWRVEQEWRVVGDVDLSRLPPHKAVVFVPTPAEARHVAGLSPWPVCVVKPPDPSG